MPDYFACSRFMFKKRHFCGQFYVTFITVLIFLHDVSAQDAAIDSLKKILRQLRDTARVGYLNRISGAYTKFIMCGACYKQLDSARSYALLAREGLALNYLRGVARAYANLEFLECERNTSILRKFAFPVSFTLCDYDKEGDFRFTKCRLNCLVRYIHYRTMFGNVDGRISSNAALDLYYQLRVF